MRSSSMATRCEQCGNRIRGRIYTSVTGRYLCSRCGARLQGRTAGVVAGGGAAGGRSTGGWYARVRKAMGRSSKG